MPTYVLMTKLGAEHLNDPRGRRAMAQAWRKQVKKLCPTIKWRAHYALLGPYDFIDIYEAPDQETAYRVSLLSRHFGAVVAESWPALAHSDYLDLAEEIEQQISA